MEILVDFKQRTVKTVENNSLKEEMCATVTENGQNGLSIPKHLPNWPFFLH